MARKEAPIMAPVMGETPLLGTQYDNVIRFNPGDGAKGFVGSTLNAANLGQIRQDIHPAAGGGTNTGAVPDLFDHDNTFLRVMGRWNVAGAMTAAEKEAFDQCIGLACAIGMGGACANYQNVQYTPATLAATGIPFAQDLATMMLSRQIVQLNLHTVDIHTVDGATKTTTIGYDYTDGATNFKQFCDGNGLQNVFNVCPAANMPPLTGAVPSCCYNAATQRFCLPVTFSIAEATSIGATVTAMLAQVPAGSMLSAYLSQLQAAVNNVIANPDLAAPVLLNEAPYAPTASWIGDTIYASSDTNAFQHMIHTNMANYIPPLTPVFLPAWTANQAAADAMLKSMSFVHDAHNNLSGKLSFTYAGQKYEKQMTVAPMLDVPYASIWPECPATGWEKYFFYTQTHELDATGTVFQSIGNVAFKPQNAGNPNKNRLTDRGTVYPMAAFPDYVEVDLDGVSIGYLFLAKPAASPAPANQGLLSIDLGSTNTIAYAKAAGAPQPLTVDPKVFCVSRSKRNGAMAQTDFFPDTAGGGYTQFMTLINDLRENQVTPGDIMESTNVLFTQDLTVENSPLLAHVNKEPLKFDQAGKVSDQTLTRCRAFIEQLLLNDRWAARQQLGCDIQPDNVTVAFPASMKMIYVDPTATPPVRVIDAVRQYYCQGGGPLPRFITEAEAIGQYVEAKCHSDFSLKEFSKQYGYAVMDIGGGSVDISLWQAAAGTNNSSKCADISLNSIAGRMITIKWLFAKRTSFIPELTGWLGQIAPDVLQNRYGIDPTIIGRLNFMQNTTDESVFTKLWNSAAEEIGQVIVQVLEYTVMDSHKATTSVLNGIKIYYEMLFYYLGEVVGSALNDNMLDSTLWANMPLNAFVIFLAGNGASFLKLGNARGLDGVHAQLIDCMSAGIRSQYQGALCNLKIQMPVVPKHEVAQGICLYFDVAAAGAPAVPGTVNADHIEQKMSNWMGDEQAAFFDVHGFANAAGIGDGVQHLVAPLISGITAMSNMTTDERFKKLVIGIFTTPAFHP